MDVSVAQEKHLDDDDKVIDPISRPLAKSNEWTTEEIYELSHGPVILACFYAAFPYLVQDPVNALQWMLLPLALSQAVYCVICLPPASGSSSAHPSNGKNARKKRVSFAKTATSWTSKCITAAFSLFLTATLATPVMTIGLVLLGAPLLGVVEHDVLTAAHMAILSATPLFYVHGVDGRIWWEVSAAFLPFDYGWGGAVGTVLGAWFGAVPIPLDWDREWQKWPVTIIAGAYIGWAIFRPLGRFLLYGKRIDFDGKPRVKRE